MIIQIIKLKSALTEQELLEKAHERSPKFKAIPGLVQKYYVKQEMKESMVEFIFGSRKKLCKSFFSRNWQQLFLSHIN